LRPGRPRVQRPDACAADRRRRERRQGKSRETPLARSRRPAAPWELRAPPASRSREGGSAKVFDDVASGSFLRWWTRTSPAGGAQDGGPDPAGGRRTWRNRKAAGCPCPRGCPAVPDETASGRGGPGRTSTGAGRTRGWLGASRRRDRLGTSERRVGPRNRNFGGQRIHAQEVFRGSRDLRSNDAPQNFSRGPFARKKARSAAAAPAAVKAGRSARPAGVALTAAGRRRQWKGKGREAKGPGGGARGVWGGPERSERKGRGSRPMPGSP
jgi:hypothetical protein